MRLSSRLLGGVTAAALLLATSGAQAATYFAEVGHAGWSRGGESSASAHAYLRTPRRGFARADATDFGLRSQVETDVARISTAKGGFEETYRILGPAADLVPVLVSAIVQLSGQGDFRASGAIDVWQGGDEVLDLDYGLQRRKRPTTRRIVVRREIYLEPNVDFVFTLETFARAARGEAGASAALR